MMQALAIRPEPGLSATLEAARAEGLAMDGVPLFEVRSIDWEAPDPARYDAILAGSANAFRHGGEGLESLRALPVHAVGQATADAARAAGFEVASVGEGGLQSLIDSGGPEPRRLLRLAGRDRVSLDIPDRVTLDTRTLYESVAVPLPQSIADQLSEPTVVLLHSARAAQHFRSECKRLRVGIAHLHLAALGPRIAAAAGPGWAAVHSAAEPREPALLALVKVLCHRP